MNAADLQQARALLHSGHLDEALARYRRLVKQSPGAAFLWFELGNAAAGLRQLDAAGDAWKKARALEPHHPDLLLTIGHQYAALRPPGLAREHFAAAAQASPGSVNPRMALAAHLEKSGDLPAARAALDECLALDPLDEQARFLNAVLLRRSEDFAAAGQQLRDLLFDDLRHPYVRYAVHYELAAVLDRTGQHDEAFASLLTAKEIVRNLTDIPRLWSEFDDAARARLSLAREAPPPPPASDAPSGVAFLGGHPRSGTTLLETILDAHPDITAVDEGNAFHCAISHPLCQGGLTPAANRLQFKPAAARLRQAYHAALQQDAGESATGLLVDKNPSLTASLPLWLRVMPELRVIIALRDPRDVVLSCFFQNIPLNLDNANFLTLERTVHHFTRLMSVWHAVREWPGFHWIETRYESLIAAPESEGRRSMDFLGLPWHEAQASPHLAVRPATIAAPTAQEVTKPIHTRAAGRWRAYEKHLAPFINSLLPFDMQ